MKSVKIWLAIIFITYSCFVFGQQRANLFIVPNNTTAFGIGLPAGTIVYNAFTNTFHEITAPADGTKTLITATTEIAGSAIVVVSDSLKAGITDSLLIGTNFLVVTTTGQIGLGTDAPTEKLDIIGDIKADTALFAHLGIGAISDRPITIKGNGANPNWISLNDNTGTLWGIDGSSGGILIEEEGTNDKNLFIEDGGDVGIGTTTLEGTLTIDDNGNDPKLVITPRTSGSLNSSIELHGNSSINSEGGIIQYLNGDKEFVFNNVDADGGAGGDIGYHFQIDGVDKMIIQKDGNIGIGTTSPGGLLGIKDANTFIDKDGSNNLTFTDAVTGTKTLAELVSGSGSGWTDAGSNVHLTTSGDLVGLGTTTPLGKIHVVGTNGSFWRLREVNMHQMLHHGSSDRYWSIAPRNSDEFSITSQSTDPGTGIISKGNDDFTIDANGNITGPFGSYHVASDSTLKKDIVTLDSALYKIGQIRGVEFHWKDTSLTSNMQCGIIAQELEQIIPTTIYTDTFGIKSVEWWQLNGLFIEAIKELNQPIGWLDIQRKSATNDQTGIDQGIDIILDSANGNIAYNITTGVATLKAGKVYALWGTFAVFSISTGETIAIQWVKASDNIPLYEGHETRLRPQSSSSDGNNQPTIKLIYKPTVDTDVKLRCTEYTGTPDTFSLYWDRSFATINELR